MLPPRLIRRLVLAPLVIVPGAGFIVLSSLPWPRFRGTKPPDRSGTRVTS